MDCENCGDPIVGSGKRYCSRSCAITVNNAGVRRHGSEPVKSKCICGEEVTRNTFCSHKCRARAMRLSVFEQIENGTYATKGGQSGLRHYLEEKRGKICAECGLSEWQGCPIPLDVDHIDGNPENHKLDNIQLLCKNCHALTPTYGAKNKGQGRESRRKFYKEHGYS